MRNSVLKPMRGKPIVIGIFIILMYIPTNKVITIITSERILNIPGNGLPGYKSW